MAKKTEKTADKENQPIPILVNFPPSLLEKVDKYQDENYLSSRTASIFELLRIGLGELDRRSTQTQSKAKTEDKVKKKTT
ncbi:hypothetical protein ABEX78_33450 [Priestia megaterium]